MKNQLIIAIDFDKTLADTDYPRIKGLFEHAKEVVNKWYEQGAYIIIWTCRTGRAELEAEKFLLDSGVKFHKINDHHPNGLLNYGNPEQIEHKLSSRKIWSHVLIDDTSIDWMLNGHPGWLELDRTLQSVIARNPNHWDIEPSFNPDDPF